MKLHSIILQSIILRPKRERIDMYTPGTWARAFINSLEGEGLSVKEGIGALKALSAQAKALPGLFYGMAASEKLEKFIRKAAADNASAGLELAAPSFELVVRFLVLTVRKNMFRHINLIIKEIEKLTNKKSGIQEAFVEYAFPLVEKNQAESRIIEAIKKRSGAADVVLKSEYKPGLIGGYRIRIGDEIIDASVLFQLEKLKTALVSGQTALVSGQTALGEY